MGQKPVQKCRRSAAPVGVASSPRIPSEYAGIPFRSSRVAGAGTGSMPWAQRTVPHPTWMGEHHVSSGAI